MLSLFVLAGGLAARGVPVFGAEATRVNPPLSDCVLARVRAFRANEDALPLIAGHAATVRIVGEGEGRPARTRRVLLLTHGLFNSPVAVRPIDDHFVAKGMNTISVRLPAHYELDPRAIRSTVRWQDWVAAVAAARALAEDLGDEVVMVGHSTGALALTWSAVLNPERVAGLALFAPAFKVHLASALLSNVTRLFRLAVVSPSGRQLNGYAGRQVRDMARAFERDLAARARPGEGGYAFATRRLAFVPVWMGNTGIDTVIDLNKANHFYAGLELGRGGGAARGRYVIPKCEMLIHDNIPTARNPWLRTLLESMDEVIR